MCLSTPFFLLFFCLLHAGPNGGGQWHSNDTAQRRLFGPSVPVSIPRLFLLFFIVYGSWLMVLRLGLWFSFYFYFLIGDW